MKNMYQYIKPRSIFVHKFLLHEHFFHTTLYLTWHNNENTCFWCTTATGFNQIARINSKNKIVTQYNVFTVDDECNIYKWDVLSLSTATCLSWWHLWQGYMRYSSSRIWFHSWYMVQQIGTFTKITHCVLSGYTGKLYCSIVYYSLF